MKSVRERYKNHNKWLNKARVLDIAYYGQKRMGAWRDINHVKVYDIYSRLQGLVGWMEPRLLKSVAAFHMVCGSLSQKFWRKK
jgi:hypothetical protein